MKKPLAVAAVLIAFLALSGCAAGDDTSNSARVAGGSTAIELDAPTEAEATAEPAVRYDDEVDDADSIFLAAVHDGSIVGLDSTSDAELVEAGLKGCAQLVAGADFDALAPITGASAGEQVPGANDRNITAIASQTLCPSQDVTLRP